MTDPDILDASAPARPLRASTVESRTGVVVNALRRRAGLVMNPHLFRHAVAKIVVELDPGLYLAMSRQLATSAST